MRFKFLTVALVAAEAITSSLRAEEPVKVIRAEIKILSTQDHSFNEMQLPQTFASGQSVPLEGTLQAKFQESLGSGKCWEVLSSPQLSMLPGQPGTVSIGQCKSFTTRITVENRDGNVFFIPGVEDFHLGLRLDVTPELSPDNRAVFLRTNFVRTDLASEHVPLCPVTTMVAPTSMVPKELTLAANAVVPSGELTSGAPLVPFTQFIQQPKVRTLSHESTLAVQDGKTVLVYLGCQKRTPRVLSSCPLLNPLPFASLFRFEPSQPVTEHYCMLVTAKIESLASMPPMPAAVAPEPRRSVLPTVPVVQPVQEVIAVAVESPHAEATIPAKHATVLKVLLEQYEVACRDGEHAKAKAIAAHCLELDPACFTKK
jgi:hypothetical protein